MVTTLVLADGLPGRRLCQFRQRDLLGIALERLDELRRIRVGMARQLAFHGCDFRCGDVTHLAGSRGIDRQGEQLNKDGALDNTRYLRPESRAVWLMPGGCNLGLNHLLQTGIVGILGVVLDQSRAALRI